MSSTPDTLPRISRPDVDAVLVGVLNSGGGEGQEAVADAVVSHWRSAEWPEGLVSVNCFTSTQNGQVLTYEQWASEETLQKSLLDGSGFRGAPTGSGGPVPYRLYQVVRGTAVSNPPPPARSFPVAAFPMESHEEARQWIDDLLKAEEAAAGADRAYPGAIAANIHIALDGRSVLIFSEWLSEDQAITHMQIVTKAMLMDVGNSEDDLGSLYRHHTTLTR